MIPGGLYVAETALKSEIAIERRAACDFHCLLDRADGRTSEYRTANHDAVGRLLARLCRGCGVEHVAMGQSRHREPVLHLADEISYIVTIAAAACATERNVARG